MISKNKLDRLIFTLGIIIIYRFTTFIVVPGLDHSVIASFCEKNDGILSLFNKFSGGAIGRMSIMALGLGPYISASIMMQMLTLTVPELKAFKKDSYQRRKINQYTRLITVLVAFGQSVAGCFLLENVSGLVVSPGMFFRITAVLSMASSSLLIMWLSEKISEGGIGNGSSMVIFCSIVASGAPLLVDFAYANFGSRTLFLSAIVLVLFSLFIVFFEGIRYNIRIFFKRNYIVFKETQVNSMSDFLPTKLNPSGILPSMFADNTMIIFALIVRLVEYLFAFTPSGIYFELAQVLFKCVLVCFFAFFCLAMSMNAEDVSENLRSRGAYLYGVFEGTKTTEYLEMFLNRITFLGCIYLLLIIFVPEILRIFFGISCVSGFSLLICFGIAGEILNRLAPEPKEISL